MKHYGSLIAAFAALAPTADAETVTWRISGAITDQLARPVGEGGVPAGSPLDVYLTFDTAAPDLDGDPTRGIYRNLINVSIFVDGAPLDALWRDNIFAGNFVPSPAWSTLTVYNDALVGGSFNDGIEFLALDPNVVGGDGSASDLPRNQVSVRLSAQTASPGGLLIADAIPGTTPDPLSFFSVREIEISGFFTPLEAYYFKASLDSATPVPIPAAAWLLLSGFGLLGAAARGAQTAPRCTRLRSA